MRPQTKAATTRAAWVAAEPYVRAFQAGDRTAFAEVVRLVQHPLRLHLLAMTRRDVDDLAQETLIRIMLKLPTLKDVAAFQAWALRIARNVLADRGRLELRALVDDRGRIEDLTDGDRADRPDQAAASAAELEALERGLAAIRPEWAEVLSLIYLQGMTYAEAGAVIGCPEGTVGSARHRGLAALRAFLNAERGRHG